VGCQSVSGPAPTAVAPATGQASAREEKDLPPQESAKVCLKTAQTLENNGAEMQAIALYEKARNENPKLAYLCRRLGVLYDRQGNFTRALEEYQKALLANPRDFEVLNDVGYSYYTRGKMPEAEKYLRQAVEVNPNYTRAWVNLGMVLGAEQRYEESLDAFAKAVPPAQAQSNLGFILTAQGKRTEAMMAYRSALLMDSNLVAARGALDKLEQTLAAPPSGYVAAASGVAAVAPATASLPTAPSGGWSEGTIKWEEAEPAASPLDVGARALPALSH
jgi:tetratricopeptide (TPR) repeat protein